LVILPPGPVKPFQRHIIQFPDQLLEDKTMGFTSTNPVPGTQINNAALNRGKTHRPCTILDFVFSQGSKKRINLKETEFRAGGVAQVEECLLCKHKVLSSNPSPTKKEKLEVILKNNVIPKKRNN
jgi:hypothetical protein